MTKGPGLTRPYFRPCLYRERSTTMNTTKPTKPAARVYRSGQQIKSKRPVPQLAPRRDPWVWALFGPKYKPTTSGA